MPDRVAAQANPTPVFRPPAGAAETGYALPRKRDAGRGADSINPKIGITGESHAMPFHPESLDAAFPSGIIRKSPNDLLAEREIPCDQQQEYEIVYKGERVGEYIPDLIAYEKIVVDTKVVEKITDREIGQMMNYLKVSGLRLGYILNFKHPRLQWKRVIR